MHLIVREAQVADLSAVADIYNHSVQHSLAVFTEIPTTVEERAAWFAARRAADCPVLVGVADGTVVGFASFGQFRPWPGYRFTVEHSVYVSQTHQGRGVGTALMNALLDAAAARGKHVMVAGVEATNLASVRFHQRLGFRHAGTLPSVGFKFGRFVDLTFLYRLLGPDARVERGS